MLKSKKFKLKSGLAIALATFIFPAGQHCWAQSTSPVVSSVTPSLDLKQSNTSPTYTVVACNDGDTCRLKSADNTQIKVRLAGIDAPEMSKKRGKKKGEGQPGGEDAKAFLNNLVVGKTVLLRSYGVDMYGRNLAEIIINNESANLKMVSEGWAEVYRGKKSGGLNIALFETAEQDARKAKKGIWALPGYESPKDWRKKHNN
ncbi:MAG: hypothetical protein RI932_2205 [Pseudomonadota bacterium]